MTVRVMDDRYDPSTGVGDVFVTLQPCEGRFFEVHLPATQILYVKKWKNMVMLSGIDLVAVAALSGQSPPPEDVA